jgi:putative transposase
MSKPSPLQYGSFYHIYNRGNNSEDLFTNEADYHRFLIKYQEYLPPVAETYAFVLMKNRFHFLVRIREEDQIQALSPENPGTSRFKIIPDLSGPQDTDRSPARYPKPDRQFSHLFNSYARYFNIKYNRHGALFERPFRRKPVENEQYLKNLIIYIHNNPVIHGFTTETEDYMYSSYHHFFSDEDSMIENKIVLSWFGDLKNFIQQHKDKMYSKPSNEWFIE